jgi:hypothetical protein
MRVVAADRSDQDVQDLEALPTIKIDLPPRVGSASASDIKTPRPAAPLRENVRQFS